VISSVTIRPAEVNLDAAKSSTKSRKMIERIP